MSSNQDDVVLAEFPRKGGREVLRVSLSEFKGNHYIDLRIWAETERGLVATRAGATVPLDRLSELITALEAGRIEAIQAGWLDLERAREPVTTH